MAKIRTSREDLTFSILNRKTGQENEHIIRSWRLQFPFGPADIGHQLVVRASDVSLVLRITAGIEKATQRVVSEDPFKVLGQVTSSCASLVTAAIKQHVDTAKISDIEESKTWASIFYEGVLAAGHKPHMAIQMLEGAARSGPIDDDAFGWVKETLESPSRSVSIGVEEVIDVVVDSSDERGTICYVRESSLRVSAESMEGQLYTASALRLSADIIQATRIFDEYIERAEGGVVPQAQRNRAVKKLPPKTQEQLKKLAGSIRNEARKNHLKFWPEEPDFFFMEFDEEAIAEMQAAEDAKRKLAEEQWEHAESNRTATFDEMMADAALDHALDNFDMGGDAEAVLAEESGDYLDDIDEFDDSVGGSPTPARGSQSAPAPAGPPKPIYEARAKSQLGDPPPGDMLDVALLFKRLADKVAQPKGAGLLRPGLDDIQNKVRALADGRGTPAPAMAETNIEPEPSPALDLSGFASDLRQLSDRVGGGISASDVKSSLHDMLVELDRLTAAHEDAMAAAGSKPNGKAAPAPAAPDQGPNEQELADYQEVVTLLGKLSEDIRGGLEHDAAGKRFEQLTEMVNQMSKRHAAYIF